MSISQDRFFLYIFSNVKKYIIIFMKEGYIMNNKVMSGKTAKMLVLFSAFFLILLGMGLYKLFDYQGYGEKKINKFVDYNVKDYIEPTPIIFNNYGDVYSSINVSKITFKNLDGSLTKTFENDENELINYINKYYDEIKKEDNYDSNSTANTLIKTQINSTILSVFYEMDFEFQGISRNYVITLNIDLNTNKSLTVDDLLSKYSYSKEYIADKLFNDEILIGNNEVIIDKTTKISLTKSDIEKKKNEYVQRITQEFDNIIKVYIENNSLVLVYNKKDLNDLFFDNNYNSQLKLKYLK